MNRIAASTTWPVLTLISADFIAVRVVCCHQSKAVHLPSSAILAEDNKGTNKKKKTFSWCVIDSSRTGLFSWVGAGGVGRGAAGTHGFA
jgi:hypothetical protein